jgi:hypothetical protein
MTRVTASALSWPGFCAWEVWLMKDEEKRETVLAVWSEGEGVMPRRWRGVEWVMLTTGSSGGSREKEKRC